jgi:hypothetical protein
MKTQITVTERNPWEGETFNYVLYVTEKEKKVIKQKIANQQEETLSLKDSNYDEKTIEEMNLASNNEYMDFFAIYKLEKNALRNWKDYGDCFYKGVGLEKCATLEEALK